MENENLSEREKSLRGLPYDPVVDMQLVKDRLRARQYTKKYNVNTSIIVLPVCGASLENMLYNAGLRSHRSFDSWSHRSGLLWTRRASTTSSRLVQYFAGKSQVPRY